MSTYESETRHTDMDAFQHNGLLSGLLESVNDLVWCTSVDGSDLLFLNRAAERIYGRPVAELIENKTLWIESIHPDDRSDVLANLKSLPERRQIEQEYRVVRPDGEVRWLQDHLSLVCDEHGNPEYIGGIATDVTERHLAEIALRESEAVYHSLVESLPLNVLRKDLDGRIVFGNQRYCRAIGVPFEELIGKTDFDLFPDDLARKYRKDDEKVLASGEILRDVEAHQTPNGEKLYVEVLKGPVRNADGQVVGIQLIFWNVTDRKLAEQALEYERYLLHTLMTHLPDSIYFKDRESRFVRVSKGLAGKFGLNDPADVIGKSDADFFSAEHAEEARADELELMRTGEPVTGKVEKETWFDGKQTWCSSTKLPLLDENGSVIGTFGVSRDVTELRDTEEKLRAARDAADAANRAKSDFLANMSHEIRTPMNAVIGMTELLLDSGLDASQREYVRMVHESGESLLSIINDILDFSKIESGKFDLDTVRFRLEDTLGDTMKTLAVRAHAKGVELAIHLAPDVPQDLIGDPGRLRQVLTNLVGNAIKFTESGEVVLDVRCDARSDGDATLCFSVTDTGIGIPADKLGRVFEAFEQVDSSTTRRFGGTGLGLAITSRLVNLMGGRISVESEVGRGSEFEFTARFAILPDLGAPRNLRDESAIGGLRVLIVDDNATNRRILDEMLANHGMRPATAESAEQAMHLLRDALASENAFRLVLTDINMPDVDGFTLVEQIRQSAEMGSTAIIVLTSGDRSGDTKRCRELEVAAHLMKPVIQSDLLDAIVDALGARRQLEVDAPSSDECVPVRPLRILLAEDAVANQVLAVGLLSRWDHTVVVANDGREAIKLVQAQPFDLVLMDVQMPEIDGLEATREIRRLEAEGAVNGESRSPLPIVAMTAHAMKGDRERCLESGMDGYVAKPIHSRELQLALFDIFGAEWSEPIESATDAPDQGAAVVDWETALAAAAGSRDLLADVVSAVLKEYPSLMKSLRAALERGDLKEVGRCAHTLRGLMRTFDSRQAASAASAIEDHCQGGADTEIGSLIDALDSELSLVARELSAFLDETRA